MPAQVRVLAGERMQHFADGGAGELHRILLAGELAKRSGDQNLSHRSVLPWELPSGRNPGGSYWRDRSAPSLSIVRRRRTRGRNAPDRAWKNRRRNRDGSEKLPARPTHAPSIPGPRDAGPWDRSRKNLPAARYRNSGPA